MDLQSFTQLKELRMGDPKPVPELFMESRIINRRIVYVSQVPVSHLWGVVCPGSIIVEERA